MSLTTDDFAEFIPRDPADDESKPLGEALSELAVESETDAVEVVRDIRKQV